MFCYQCQETLLNKGCSKNGVCGKRGETAQLQDLLVYVVKGIALSAEGAGACKKKAGHFIAKALFTTITNVNYDDEAIREMILKGLELRDKIIEKHSLTIQHDCQVWRDESLEGMIAKGAEVGVLSTGNEDIRSLRELLIYGLKGIAAYIDHAIVLGYENDEVMEFLVEGMASTVKELPLDELVDLVLKAGQVAVSAMATLDKANTETYGNPEISVVSLGVRSNPGILISGHDLKDMEELLKQTENTGVDVYTHGEMLPANYYPEFKKYKHFVGNYGNSWWHQDKEFESFNGPILMTTNCLVPPRDSYKGRVFSTGTVGFPGVQHIPERLEGAPKDFSAIIEMAKQCEVPVELEKGTLVGGFAHHQVLALAEKVVEAVKSGAVKKFVVMAGCDGRHKSREYYTEFAQKLPKDTIILTAGCAKYRYNKLNLGDIGGIPRVLDAGQCNDSYSLAVIALKLKEVFGLDDINKLPIIYNIAWYEQKAVAVLLALLFLGVKDIKLGPTVPAFISPGVLDVLVNTFGISAMGEVDSDMEAMLA